MNKSYSTIANYYDNFTHNDCDYVSWSQYLFGVAKKHGAKKVVDVACGTGKMTTLLAKCGLQLIGVDNSAQMLAVANEKCKKAVFVQQDMQKLKLPSLVDMAVCVNDGANYVTAQNLTAFFQAVANNLKIGAPFVFDVSSEYKLKKVVGDNVFYVDDDNATLLWTNKVKGDTVTMSLTLFERQREVYTRKEESHTQHVHTEQSVVKSLREAGFDVVEITSDYGKELKEDSLRITFYATKK